MLTAAVVRDPASPALDGWDALATEAGRPYCAPGWMLSWWARARPRGAELRVVTVRDAGRLVGIAAFYLVRDRLGIVTWRLLGDTDASYAEPLAAPGRRGEVAAAIAGALTSADRAVDVLSLVKVPGEGGWAALLRDGWPGRPPAIAPVRTSTAPVIDVPEGGYDAWLAGLSGKTRKNVRAAQREFARSGGTFRLATTPEELSAGLDDFVRLHLARWDGRGGSEALTPRMVAMLRAASLRLDPSRLQVWTAEVRGEAAGSAIVVAAGSEMQSWLSGFDEKFARCSPSLVLTVQTVRHACEAGYRRLSLGPGLSAYKERLATGAEALETVDLLPAGVRLPYVRLCRSPYRIYRLASNRTPPEVKQRLRARLQRGPA